MNVLKKFLFSLFVCVCVYHTITVQFLKIILIHLIGVTDTPIMTWGEIEGTPFRLDGSDTPLPQNPSGQQFKIPNLSAREKIALSLADKVAKKHRKSSNIKSDFKRYFSFKSVYRYLH